MIMYIHDKQAFTTQTRSQQSGGWLPRTTTHIYDCQCLPGNIHYQYIYYVFNQETQLRLATGAMHCNNSTTHPTCSITQLRLARGLTPLPFRQSWHSSIQRILRGTAGRNTQVFWNYDSSAASVCKTYLEWNHENACIASLLTRAHVKPTSRCG